MIWRWVDSLASPNGGRHERPDATAASSSGCRSQACWPGAAVGAPAASVLPLTRGARLIASTSGGAIVDAASPGQFRYAVIAGPTGTSGPGLLESEVRLALAHGWGHEEAYVGRWSDKDQAAVLQHAPLTTSGVQVEMDSPSAKVYVALDVVTSPADADLAGGGPRCTKVRRSWPR
jgi:hypothetical protein